MKLISYSLFTTNKNFNHIRSWDNHKHLGNRYWVNIPALILVNNILYPDYKTKIYITPSIENNELFPLLDKLSKNSSFNIIIEKWNLPYSGREPSVWRMCPVWDNSNTLVYTRDIDSLPNVSEFKCSKAFEDSSCTIMSIRSHCGGHAPSGSAVRMLAGLSGFKPNKLNLDYLPKTFDEYYHNSKNFGDWGLDQGVMIHYFLEKNSDEYLKNNFMDCAINCQKQNSSWPCYPMNDNLLHKIALSPSEQQLLDIISPLTDWAGKPVDSRNVLSRIIEISGNLGQEMKSILQSDRQLKSFYNV